MMHSDAMHKRMLPAIGKPQVPLKQACTQKEKEDVKSVKEGFPDGQSQNSS